jgi:hypothetical protein
LSGTIRFTLNGGDQMGVPFRTVAVNAATALAVVNTSPVVNNVLQQVTGTNEIPAGSYLLWNPYTAELIATNKNGFSFPLSGYTDGTNYYDFGFLEFGDEAAGTYSLNAKTLAGSETDYIGFYLDLNDGLTNNNVIELYGEATLNWTYGAASNGMQKTKLSVSLAGDGANDLFVFGYNAAPVSFTGSGSGTWLERTDDIPFFYYWNF